jgi:hypothetical protein
VFIHLIVCLTTGPKPLPNRALHIVRYIASSFKCNYPLLYLNSSSSCLRFLPRLTVTSIPNFIFPSITRCRKQFRECIDTVKRIIYLGDFLPVISTFICLMWVNFGMRNLHVMVLKCGDLCVTSRKAMLYPCYGRKLN